MSDHQKHEPQIAGSTGSPDSAEFKKAPLWKKGLLALAVISLIVGFAMKASAKDSSTQSSGMSGVQSTSGGNSLVGGGTPIPGIDGGSAAVDDSGMSGYAPFFVKGGFSFLIAFCIGWALRTFFKISAFAVGVVALAILGLQQLGWVEMDWHAMSDWWDSISGKVLAKSEGFKGFLTGNMPSAGLASIGLFTGFTRG